MRKHLAAILAVTALAFAVSSAEARKTHPSELSGIGGWFTGLMGLILSE